MSLPLQEPSDAAALLVLVDGAGADEEDARTLERLARSAAAVPGVDAASCTITAPPGVAPCSAASDLVAAQLERVQQELEEGPCRDAARTRTALNDVPMVHPQSRVRWPAFTRHALDAGITAVTALPISYRGHLTGSLDLYHQHRSLGPSDAQWGQLLARAAAIGLAHRTELRGARTHRDQLQTALSSRVLIEQAKGILAERLDCTVDDAFDRLRRHARAHRMKLSDLSREVITSPHWATPFSRP
ncbi:ANTAR domain-containing protein [Streptomyces sp. NPDC087300]|uniref:ANTAR domain-containing protein n=1 Tax=Streptomyces sp. NPDC087300 TaxID=3365780 RepID=UPI00382B9196